MKDNNQIYKFDGFPIEEGDFCLLVNLRNYLDYYGLKVTENTLEVILGCYGFYFNGDIRDHGDLLNGRNGSFKDIFERLQKCLKSELVVNEISSDKFEMKYLVNLINKKKFPMVWINSKFLSHTNYYDKNTYWSLVTLLKITVDQVTYFDNGVKEISQNTFYKAILNNNHIKIIHPKDNQITWKFSNRDMIRIGLMDSIKTLTKEQANYKVQESGIKGMYKFKNQIMTYDDSDAIYHLFFLLNNPSGLMLTRRRLLDFLSSLSKLYPDIDAERICEVMKRLSENWGNVANLLFKLSRTLDKNLQSRIEDRISTCISDESLAIELLNDVTCQLSNK